MSEWIKARIDLHRDPMVVRQAAALGRTAYEIAFAWIVLWGWARSHTADGFVRDVDQSTVDAITGIPSFATSAGRWMVFSDEGVTFPNWEKHNSKGARERDLATIRQRAARQSGSGEETNEPHDPVTHDPVTLNRDNTVTRAEQSRVEQSRAEKTKQNKAKLCSAQDLPSADDRTAPLSQAFSTNDAYARLVAAGIQKAEAVGMVASAVTTHPQDGLARLIKGASQLVARQAKGRPVGSPRQYVLVAGELAKSAKVKTAEALATVRKQAEAARGGAAC